MEKWEIAWALYNLGELTLSEVRAVTQPNVKDLAESIRKAHGWESEWIEAEPFNIHESER